MSGIQILKELCTQPGILFEDPYVDRAVAALEAEGADGSRALASFIDELLVCRSPKLRSVLKAAERVEPTDELIEAVQSVRGARNLAPQPANAAYAADIVGSGQVGWTGGTGDQIRGFSVKVLESLTGAVMDEAPNLRPGADLDGAELAGANLAGSDLSGASLAGANLEGANLKESNLSNANLEGANLRKAILYFANLTGANLRGADLREANLYMSKMGGAVLAGADLTDAYAPNLTLPNGLTGDRAKLKGFT